MPYIKNLLAGLLAVGVLAVPAVASASGPGLPSLPDPIPAPAGKVQHTVTDHNFVANYTVPGKVPWHHVVESWVSARKARSITRDGDGKVLAECVVADERTRCYSAERHQISAYTSSRPDLDWASWQYRGALVKAQVDAGWYSVAGTTRVAGRKATVLESTDREPRDGPGSSSIVVDAETLAPLRRKFSGDVHGKRFTQTETVTTFEHVDPADVDFTMGPHPDVKTQDARKHSNAATRR